MTNALFCNFTRHRVGISYRRFGTNYRSHVQGSRSTRRLILISEVQHFQEDFFNIEDKTDRLSQNIGKELTQDAVSNP
jgi:hypothetical protein